ncbi:helix-turn-helix domain-containing protein [Labrenzia sp. OB1]|uniref:helix-turn-helix domain-containing protein n=1 Tax=Labrenzia sp. OB1 TaxID=1561204 RepID=UPI0007B30AB1|nr:helix-turn-helix domain-containing protein [Labrenzia sp. OB1]KZM49457.1 transcriptional regulator [Labrenzia sp. OB1]
MAKPKEVPNGGWDQQSIIAELHRQHMTLKKLAESKGRTPGTFSHVWKRRVSIAEETIAEFLETPKEELFPDRYPIRTARILSSKYDNYGASQKGNAATDKKAA